MSTLLHTTFPTSATLDNEIPSFSLPLRPASTSCISSKDISNDISLLRNFAFHRSLLNPEALSDSKEDLNNLDLGIVAPSPRKLFSPPIIFEAPNDIISPQNEIDDSIFDEANQSEPEFSEEHLVLSELLSITRPASVKKSIDKSRNKSVFRSFTFTPEPYSGFEGFSSRQSANELGSLRSGIFPRQSRNPTSTYATLPSKRSTHQHRSIIELAQDFVNEN